MLTSGVKGKKNKLNVGDKVRCLPELAKWYATHISWSYGRPVTGEQTGYSPGEKEIGEEDLVKVFFWVYVHLTGHMPIGIVRHYGAEAGIPGQNCVYIVWKIKTPNGTLTDEAYVEEKSVSLIKKVDRKKRKR